MTEETGQGIISALGGPASTGEMDQLRIVIAAQDTPQQLHADMPCRSVRIYVDDIANSGNFICIGADDVDADYDGSHAARNAPPLFQGQSLPLNNVSNLNQIYISGEANDVVLIHFFKTSA